MPPTATKPLPQPEPAQKVESGSLTIDQSALGEQMRREQQKPQQMDALGREFKTSQGK